MILWFSRLHQACVVREAYEMQSVTLEALPIVWSVPVLPLLLWDRDRVSRGSLALIMSPAAGRRAVGACAVVRKGS